MAPPARSAFRGLRVIWVSFLGPPGAGLQGASRRLQSQDCSTGVQDLKVQAGALRLPSASRSLRTQAGPRRLRAFRQRPSTSSNLEGLQELQKSPAGASRPPGASSRGLGGLQEPLTSFKLSRLSTYANEEVLLLTKMDLTEFRS